MAHLVGLVLKGCEQRSPFGARIRCPPGLMRLDRGPFDGEDEAVRILDAPVSLHAVAIGMRYEQIDCARQCLLEVAAAARLRKHLDDFSYRHAPLPYPMSRSGYFISSCISFRNGRQKCRTHMPPRSAVT